MVGWASTGASAAFAMAIVIVYSGVLLRLTFVAAVLAEGNAPEIADQADEGPAVGTGVAFRGALLSSAGTADHGVVFLKFGHTQLRT
jgi:hypothetical protein